VIWSKDVHEMKQEMKQGLCFSKAEKLLWNGVRYAGILTEAQAKE
jgi:hypothetical protein